MSLIKARKLLKDDYPYSNILEFDLSPQSSLRKNVLDIIEKRMCINFSSEFIDLIYYQSFENCLMYSDLEDAEEERMKKLTCCAKV